MLHRTIAISCILITTLLSGAQDLAPCPDPYERSAEDSVAARPASDSDMTGTWRLDRDLTSADMRWNKTNRIVVAQSADNIRIQYFHDDQLIGTETFVPDWVERPRYKTRIERAYARVRWENGGLLIRTRSFLDVLGDQSYTMEDHWELSGHGDTLTDRGSDGKLMVFYRVSSTRTPNTSIPSGDGDEKRFAVLPF